jgi:hypothetical protein
MSGASDAAPRGFFARLFRRRESLQHPELGRLELIVGAGNTGHWLQDNDDDDGVLASFGTVGNAPPTAAQVAFLRRIVGNPALILDDVQAVIAPAYAQYFGEPLPRAWPLSMRLCAVGVPLDADPANPWDLSLESEQGPIFNVAFRNGTAVIDAIDD